MKTLNISAPVGRMGYGQAGYNLSIGLCSLGWKPALFPKGPVTDRPNTEDLKNMLWRGREFFDYDAPCLHIWHQNDLSQSIGRGKYFAFPIFELNQFSKAEKYHLNYPDELIVCSKWAADIIEQQIGRQTNVVPLGYDPAIFHAAEIQKDDTYRFVNIGKWEVRKGHDVLVEIFNKAFTPKDDVELWMMPNNPFLKEGQVSEWVNWYMDSPMGQAGKIKILGPSPTQYGVHGLISSCDCGIFPTKAEGWNLELLECMASNRPVIATNYSAHTEFCTPENAFLVDIDELEYAYDGKWFFEQGEWALFKDEQIDKFVELMRYVKNNNVRTNPAGPENVSEFTWEKAAVKLEKVLLDKS